MEWTVALIAVMLMPLGLIFGGSRDATPSAFGKRKTAPLVSRRPRLLHTKPRLLQHGRRVSLGRKKMLSASRDFGSDDVACLAYCRPEALFFRGAGAKGGGHFVLFYARRRIAALTEALLFGAITHHAGMSDLGLFLSRVGGRDFLRHAKYSGRKAL